MTAHQYQLVRMCFVLFFGVFLFVQMGFTIKVEVVSLWRSLAPIAFYNISNSKNSSNFIQLILWRISHCEKLLWRKQVTILKIRCVYIHKLHLISHLWFMCQWSHWMNLSKWIWKLCTSKYFASYLNLLQFKIWVAIFQNSLWSYAGVGENRQSVTDEPVKLRNSLLKFKSSGELPQGLADFWAQPAKIRPFTTSTGFLRIWPDANLLPFIWTGQYPIFLKCWLISSSL